MTGYDLCKDCIDGVKGFCCYSSVLVDGLNVILDNHPCKFLDLKIKECTVFEERYYKNINCMPIEIAIAHNGLPVGCPYLPPDYDLSKAKIRYKEGMLSKNGELNYDLTNKSHHQYIVRYTMKDVTVLEKELEEKLKLESKSKDKDT